MTLSGPQTCRAVIDAIMQMCRNFEDTLTGFLAHRWAAS